MQHSNSSLGQCDHKPEYHYYGGTFGYEQCSRCGQWWQVDLSGERIEVDEPYTRDLLTDFVEEASNANIVTVCGMPVTTYSCTEYEARSLKKGT